ncbi:O-antigen ligase family protein [Mesorhizobium sp. M0913]|uniref:O-antigen ligase family protein n=1 Tax=Mesorhizobium sp. M0913 TaxID=2957026 RepID=UPI00333B4077
MEQLSSLLDLLFSPVGASAAAILFLVALRANSYKWPKWIVLTLTVYAASLAKFTDEFLTIPASFVGGLEFVVNNGRPVAIIFLLFLGYLMASYRSGTAKRKCRRGAITSLFIAQNVLVLKMLAAGLYGYAVLSFGIYCGVFVVVTEGLQRWLQDEREFRRCVVAIAAVGGLFVVACLIQALFNPAAIFAAQGRLNGTSGNAQHAAALLAAAVPAVAYAATTSRGSVRAVWTALLFATFACILLTGSRTGAIMSVLSLALVLDIKLIMRTVPIIGAAAIILVLLFASPKPEENGVAAPVYTRVLTFEDTRSATWQALFNSFVENPFFGMPVRGQELGFGESSWLSMGAVAGLVGFTPLLVFGILTLKILTQLRAARSYGPNIKREANVVFAGLLSLMAGSFTEAYLLGTLNAPIFYILIYLSLGYSLLSRIETKAPRSELGVSRTRAAFGSTRLKEVI